jgi:outer membrane scaffolding protein for murein synthesis (MipA/OmpV family)
MAGAMVAGVMPATACAADRPVANPSDLAEPPASRPVLPEVAFGQAPVRNPESAPSVKPQRDVYAGDYLIVGVGAAVLPAYEGSHRHHVIPAFGVGGRIHGIGLSPRSAGVALNLIPPRSSRIGLSLGPVIRYRGTRTVSISDPTPIRVGKGKGSLELGLNASIALKHIVSEYDTLSFGTDVRWDATGGTGGRVIAPGINYFTPVSKGQVIGISASADFYNQRMANQTYTVTPTGMVAVIAGATPRAGLRSVGGRIFTAYDLDHDMRNGGFSILFGIGYSRLVGSAARSPLVKSNGTHDQVVIGTGLAFAFRTRR